MQTFKQKLKQNLPGLLLTIALASIAWPLGKEVPLVGAPVFAILIGMIIRPIILPHLGLFKAGMTYSSKKILQYAIILLGFQMNLFTVFEVGKQSLSIMVFTLSTAFIVTYIMGKILKTDPVMTTLIGVGTSICGGSAIAATAPILNANDEEIAHAISTIFLFNIVAVFLFPALGQFLNMSDYGFGIFAGTAINDTSSVVAASTAWSTFKGNNTALATATVVKLTRTLMIIPISLVLSYLQSRKRKDQNLSISKIFPWFILGFLATTILSTTLHLPQDIVIGMITLGKFMIVIAMSAIGLNTALVKLLKNGFKPILLGSICWFSVTMVALFVQKTIQLW
ncbi:YeiH family protein [Fusibacter ferrireducens]|uniref:YeiH family putative sulfate export transporter n=1 Tax=Fusibacter ferrireducens TaxID=2785058 RepID=A0ABR9ZQT2_9FIRM|nr:YeiH family protein [Fusibacter ferrireducens]MBF4692676.1 YeiH family putative sulfate export transporter [Fusibacter ferrireducens]